MKTAAFIIVSALAVSSCVDAKLSPTFDLTDHTSQLNYYHPAKTDLASAEIALPAECKVDQVHAVARHMTRYPSKGSYNGLVRIETKVKAALATGNTTIVGKELEFLKTWNLNDVITNPTTQVENITALGLEEGKAFGKTMRDKYADLYNENATVWTGTVERVQLTAKSFMDGYFGSAAAATNYANLVRSNSSDPTLGGNTLTPIDTCPKFIKDSLADKPTADFRATFDKALVARLETLWPGFGFTIDDAMGMMDLCMYEMNLLGKTQRRFCEIFTDDEWVKYGYYKDLGYYYGSGYGNPLARTAGYPYVEAVARLLAQPKTPYCQKVFVAFSHDTQLNAFTSAYGLSYDETFPSDKILTSRKFRSSRQVAMGSRLVTERIKCGSQRYVRVSVNEAVLPFPDCKSGPGLSCPLEQFQKKIADTKSTVGDFATTCGVTSGALSKLELFDKPQRNLCAITSC